MDGLSTPLLIVTVEDEVTGTGALVHRLTFGVTEKDGKVEVLRDWELLKMLNTSLPKSTMVNVAVDPRVGQRSNA